MTLQITNEEKENAIEKSREFANALYKDRDIVEDILKQLNRDWKFGENVIPRLDLLQERFHPLVVLYEYFRLSPKHREEFENEIGIAGTEVATFLAMLVQKYPDIEVLVDNHVSRSAGVQNHLLRYSSEGIYFDSQRQMVLARFSIHTAGERLMQSTDHIDDLIWLATRLLDHVNDAIDSCHQNGAQISSEYWEFLKNRNVKLTEQYTRFQNLLGQGGSESPVNGTDFDFDDESIDEDAIEV